MFQTCAYCIKPKNHKLLVSFFKMFHCSAYWHYLLKRYQPALPAFNLWPKGFQSKEQFRPFWQSTASRSWYCMNSFLFGNHERQPSATSPCFVLAFSACLLSQPKTRLLHGCLPSKNTFPSHPLQHDHLSNKHVSHENYIKTCVGKPYRLAVKGRLSFR